MDNFNPTPRRLVVLATKVGFTTTNEYQDTLGYWNILSTTVSAAFPFAIVARIAANLNMQILIKAAR